MLHPAAAAATRVAAASTLLDRGWGTPLMPLVMKDARPPEDLTDPELAQIIHAE